MKHLPFLVWLSLTANLFGATLMIWGMTGYGNTLDYQMHQEGAVLWFIVGLVMILDSVVALSVVDRQEIKQLRKENRLLRGMTDTLLNEGLK